MSKNKNFVSINDQFKVLYICVCVESINSHICDDQSFSLHSPSLAAGSMRRDSGIVEIFFKGVTNFKK